MIIAVIVAGGSGSRMQAPVKKQYLHLDGVPILSRTLLAFDRFGALDRIVLVVPENDLLWCRTVMLEALHLDHDVQLVTGGGQRQESVCNGLDALSGCDGMVMIHDGVRPFVRSSLMNACLKGARVTGACIPAILVTDTLKRVDRDGMIAGTLDRQQICLAQTPQTFAIDLIRSAHRLVGRYGAVVTDDASVAEFAGKTVKVVPGNRDNIKITTPQDLIFARAILQRWNTDAD